MTKLHLGVIVQPYVTAPPPRRKGRKPKKVTGATITTADVAGYLEAKYHVMEIFYQRHEKQIAQWLAESVEGAMEDLLAGAPFTADIFVGAMGNIEDRFKKFIDMKEMDGQPGVPTAASLKGVSKRFKLKRGPVRPSFLDTTLYQGSFKAWTD